MCGADVVGASVMRMVVGSPPHVRGGLLWLEDFNDVYWFTPACAGRMCNVVCIPRGIRVHPRMCGADGSL